MATEKITSIMDFTKRINLTITEQGIVKSDNQWRWHNVTSPFHRLYYIRRGKVYVRDEHRTYSLMSGHLYLIKRNTWMDYYAEEPFEKLYFHLNYYSDAGFDLLDGCQSVITLEADDSLLEKLASNFYGDTSAEKAAVISCLYHVLSLVTAQVSEIGLDPYQDGIYGALIREMVSRSNINLSVEEMAAYTDQSISDFSRKFKADIGVPPKLFLHNQIIEKAKMQLLTTETSIKSIGLDLGFEDSLYFSRFFKKRTGLSPKLYRKSQIT